MCTYNGAAYLAAQLKSINSQTRLPDELVICDDSSSDATLDILKEFAASAPFPVRLNVNERNLGVVKNFEKAIALCEGSIIALSDQDDVWLPHKLGRLEEVMKANGAALVFSDAHVVDDALNSTGQKLWEFTFQKADQELLASGNGVRVLLKRSVVTGATMAFLSELRKMLLPIPATGHLIHDNWIALLIAASSDVAFIDEPLMNYRQHPNQHTGIFEPPGKLPRISVTRVRAESLRSMANFYQIQVARYETASARLRMRPQDPNIQKNLALIEEEIAELKLKAAHFSCRAEMSEYGVRRVPAAIKELCQLGYHRYSNGFLSFAKDVLR
jgi:glycosyltransferase involved in cell wall biosynthesis